MAAPYTTTTAVSKLVADAVDRSVDFYLQPKAQLRSCVTKAPVSPSYPSDTYKMYIHKKLSNATTPLDEVSDGSGTVVSEPDEVTINIATYGERTVLTGDLENFTFAEALRQDIVTIFGDQQVNTIDALVNAKLAAGTQVLSIEGGNLVKTGNAVNDITATDTIQADAVRHAVAKLRGAAVSGMRGDLFVAHVHPDVAADLREEAGSGGWRAPSEYAAPDRIWSGETGVFEGVSFIENPRVGTATNTGSVKVYNTYIVGQGALAEAVVSPAQMVLGGTIEDPFMRKFSVAWKVTAGWALYRPESLWVVKTASSHA